MGGPTHIHQLHPQNVEASLETSRLRATIKAIEVVSQWDRAETSAQNFLFQLKAAQSLEIFQPFTAEQQALSDYLSARMAGRRLCEYAWRSYAQSL